MEAQTTFTSFKCGSAVFKFRCTCGTRGELAVPERDRNSLVPCPGRCGAQYIQRRGRGFFAQPSLELAIAPRRERGGERCAPAGAKE
jgi:hypothetical protein